MLMKVKKWYTTILYFMSMAQRNIGVIFWVTTSSGVWYPIFRDLEWFPIKGWFLLIFLLCANFIGVLLFGWMLYGLVKLWDTEQRVIALRNPFIRGTLTPKEIIQLEKLWLPLLKTINKEGELDETINRIKRWIEKGEVTQDMNIEEIEQIIKRMEKI